MVYQVIGTQRKTGEYQGNMYDNTMLYVTAEMPNVNGYYCTSLKAKTINVPPTLKVGDVVDVYFDRFGNVDAIFIKNKEGKE